MGMNQHTTIMCERCDGTGVALIDDGEIELEDECPDCEGTGFLDDVGYSSDYSDD